MHDRIRYIFSPASKLNHDCPHFFNCCDEPSALDWHHGTIRQWDLCQPKWQCGQETPWRLSLGVAQVAKVIIVAAFDSSDVFLLYIECIRVYQLSIKEFISRNHGTWVYIKRKSEQRLEEDDKGRLASLYYFFSYTFWKESWLTWLKTFSGSKPLTLQDCLVFPHNRASPDWYICSVSSSSNFIFSLWKHVMSRRPFRIPGLWGDQIS